jgi:PAS domain S-box-containing protein
MLFSSWSLLLSAGFIPHGHCYLWKPSLVWLHLISDSLIAIAYYSIPITLVYFVRKRRDLPYDWIFLLFGSFIVACGTTHLMEVWTLWHPTYWLSGGIKVATAIISLYTAAILIRLMPKALALPSPAQLEAANRELECEILERAQTELALKESQRFVQKLADTAPIQLYVYDIPSGQTVYTNQGTTSLLDHAVTELQGKSTDTLDETIHPDDLELVTHRHQQWKSAGEGEIRQLEYRVKQPDGSWRYIQSQETLFVRDATGQPQQILGVAVDITAAKQLEEVRKAEEQLQASLRDKEVLLKEIHHRVKNNLQIVYSLLRLQYRRVEDRFAAEILMEAQNRIKAIALIHEKLYRSENLSQVNLTQYVPNLVAGLLHSYQTSSKPIQLNTDIEPISLDLDAAIPCGLILNELITNALKYAFPGDRLGEIRVKFYKNPDHTATLVVQDNGIGLPRELNIAQTDSLGLGLVQDLVQQINGCLSIDRTQGTIFKITFAGGCV